MLTAKIRVKKILVDFGLNIIASMLLTLALQIAIYPYLASRYEINEYGIILIIMGIYNTIVSTIGTSLNNIRLIKNGNYQNEKAGDFNLILAIFIFIGGLSSFLVFRNALNIDITTTFFLIIATTLGIIKSYSSVIFRIQLNFLYIFYCSIITVVGYILGLFLIRYIDIWPLAFCLGELLACIFIFNKTNVFSGKFLKSKMFNDTFNGFLLLLLTNLVANLLVYLDRLLLLPFLGAENVTIYTVASFFGKSMGVIMIPISGVLLGYYAQKNFKMSLKRFWYINYSIIFMSIIFFIVSSLISPWVTQLLYPRIAGLSTPYILLANLASIIGIAANIVHPSVLKYADIKWQVCVQVVFGLVYILLGIVMIRYDGLRGFCIAAIIANITRLLMLFFIGTFYIRKGENVVVRTV